MVMITTVIITMTIIIVILTVLSTMEKKISQFNHNTNTKRKKKLTLIAAPKFLAYKPSYLIFTANGV